MPSTPTWSATQDAALADLLLAWHRMDDLRRSSDFAARSQALLELEQARRAFRASTRPVLAA